MADPKVGTGKKPTGKAEQAALARKAKEQLRKAHGRKTGDNKTQSKTRKKTRVQRKSKSSK
jgi:hypothetical protein